MNPREPGQPYSKVPPPIFFVYENFRNKRAVVHLGICVFCNNGRGRIEDADPDNGRWSKSFSTKEEAVAFAERTGRKSVKDCERCYP